MGGLKKSIEMELLTTCVCVSLAHSIFQEVHQFVGQRRHLEVCEGMTCPSSHRHPEL